MDGMGIQISCVSGNAPRHPHNSTPTQLNEEPPVLTAAEYLIGETDVVGGTQFSGRAISSRLWNP